MAEQRAITVKKWGQYSVHTGITTLLRAGAGVRWLTFCVLLKFDGGRMGGMGVSGMGGLCVGGIRGVVEGANKSQSGGASGRTWRDKAPRPDKDLAQTS